MRIPSLDGVRAIALVVLLAHLSGTRNIFSSYLLEMYGNFGVRVFLVLSGYLITYLLLKDQRKTGTIPLRRFFVRRAYRIFPAAYVFMIMMIAAHWKALSWPNMLAVLTYTSSYYHSGPWWLGTSSPCRCRSSFICSGR